MSTYTKLAYGTILSLVTAGTALFYATRETVQQVDIVELVEGLLEREAAVAPWPFTCYATNAAGWNTTQRIGAYIPPSVRAAEIADAGVADWAAYLVHMGFADDTAAAAYLVTFYPGKVSAGGTVTVIGTNTSAFAGTNWSFNNFPGLPLIGSGPSRDLIVRIGQRVEALVPQFDETVTNGIPVPWAGSNFWVAADIGGGTYPLWTVGRTNGVPIYGPITGLVWHGQTDILEEQYRALRIMTNSHRDSAWQLGRTFATNHATAFTFEAAAEHYDIAPPDPQQYPVWWTNILGYDWIPDALYGTNWAYPTGWTESVQAPHETIRMAGPGQHEASQGIWVDDPSQYLFQPGYSYSDETAARHVASGGVWVAGLASGVTVSVSIPWSVTGSWEVVSGDLAGATTNVTGYGAAGTAVVSVACSGVSTSWAGLASVLPPQGVSNFVDVAAAVASGAWTNNPITPLGVYDQHPQPTITGYTSNSFPRPAILRWTFTRCKP